MEQSWTIPEIIAGILANNNGESNEWLGQRLGVSRNQVSMYNRGKSKPSVRVCQRLAALSGVPFGNVMEAAGLIEDEISEIVQDERLAGLARKYPNASLHLLQFGDLPEETIAAIDRLLARSAALPALGRPKIMDMGK